MPFDLELLHEKYGKKFTLEYITLLNILFHQFHQYIPELADTDNSVNIYHVIHREFSRTAYPEHRFYTDGKELESFPHLDPHVKINICFDIDETLITAIAEEPSATCPSSHTPETYHIYSRPSVIAIIKKLALIPGIRLIAFTNAAENHAGIVLEKLGLIEYIKHIICKPNGKKKSNWDLEYAPYLDNKKILTSLHDFENTLLFDDSIIAAIESFSSLEESKENPMPNVIITPAFTSVTCGTNPDRILLVVFYFILNLLAQRLRSPTTTVEELLAASSMKTSEAETKIETGTDEDVFRCLKFLSIESTHNTVASVDGDIDLFFNYWKFDKQVVSLITDYHLMKTEKPRIPPSLSELLCVLRPALPPVLPSEYSSTATTTTTANRAIDTKDTKDTKKGFLRKTLTAMIGSVSTFISAVGQASQASPARSAQTRLIIDCKKSTDYGTCGYKPTLL